MIWVPPYFRNLWWYLWKRLRVFLLSLFFCKTTTSTLDFLSAGCRSNLPVFLEKTCHVVLLYLCPPMQCWGIGPANLGVSANFGFWGQTGQSKFAGLEDGKVWFLFAVRWQWQCFVWRSDLKLSLYCSLCIHSCILFLSYEQCDNMLHYI